MSLRYGLGRYIAALGASSLLVLSGCATTALSPGKSVLDVQAARDSAALNVSQQPAVFPPHPSGFDWASRTLQSTGSGSAAPGMPASQGKVAAQNSATVHAKAALKDQVRALPVGSDQTIGSIMGTYIALRLAVEKEVAGANVTSTRPLPNGNTEVQVELPMQNIANLLQQHQITPDQALPAAGDRPAGVPNII